MCSPFPENFPCYYAALIIFRSRLPAQKKSQNHIQETIVVAKSVAGRTRKRSAPPKPDNGGRDGMDEH